MPRETTTDDRRTRGGYLILIGIVAAAVLIFNLNALRDLTREHMDVVALLYDASGVTVGTPVRVAGVESGRVVGISFLPAGARTEVALNIRVDRRTRSVLRTDSDVRALRLRAIGQPVVQLEPGTSRGRPVESGDTLRARSRVTPDELLARARALPAAVDSLLRAGREVQAMARTRAPELEQLRARVDGALAAAARLGDDLERGSLGRMIGPGGALDRVAALRTRLDEVTAALGPALERYAPSAEAERSELAASLDALSARVATLGADLDAMSGGVEGGGGILDRMGRDSALQVAIRGVQAQMDSLRQEAGSIAWRMVLP